MDTAKDIVNKMLEGDPDDPQRYLGWLISRQTDLDSLDKIQFGVAIHLSDEHMIREVASEAGIDVDDQAFWDEIERCSAVMEANCLRILREAGLHVSDEGHDEDARVASVWINTPDSDRAIALVKAVINWADGDWPSTTSGTMDYAFGADTTQRIYAMTEDAARFLDVTIEFTGTDALVEWSQLNLTEAVDPDDPEQFVKSYATRDAWPELTALCQWIKEYDLGYSGSVKRTGRYVHQNSTDFTLDVDSNGTDLTPEQEAEVGALADTVQAGIQEEIRDTINERIYRALEREYEYQNSDEMVAENILANTYTFDADGNRDDDDEALTYDQLADLAQERARDWYRRAFEHDDMWHEHTLDEWKAELAEMGFVDADIAFSGFWSQGDGASFTCPRFDIFKYAEFFKYGQPTERGRPYTDALYESIDDPAPTYIEDIHDFEELATELETCGLTLALTTPWGRWLVISGPLLQPYPVNYQPQTLVTPEQFRACIERVLAKYHITRFHLTIDNAGRSYRLALPKAQLEWDSIKKFPPKLRHKFDDLPEALDPDDPAVNVERHTADLDINAVMAKLGFVNVRTAGVTWDGWTKRIGNKEWRVWPTTITNVYGVTRMERPAKFVQVGRGRRYGQWSERGGFTCHVSELEQQLREEGALNPPVAEALDPDDPAVNVDRHIAAMDIDQIMDRLGFSKMLPSWKCADPDYCWYEKHARGLRVTAIRADDAEPQMFNVSFSKFQLVNYGDRGTFPEYKEVASFKTHVGELEIKLRQFLRTGKLREAADPDDPGLNIEQHAQRVQAGQDTLDSVIDAAVQEFERRVDERGITTASEADELAAETGSRAAERAGYANGSDEFDWVVSAVNSRASEMFPGQWEDYVPEAHHKRKEMLPLATLLETCQPTDHGKTWPEVFAHLETSPGKYLDELLRSIKQRGIQYPVKLDEHMVVNGHRRLWLAHKLGIENVPVTRDTDPLTEAEIQSRRQAQAAHKADARILSVIRATTEHFGHDFTGGDCGNFAIALVRYLTEQGIPASYLVEHGSHYEMFDHVTVLVNGIAYDGNGVYQKKHGKGYDEWNEQDYDIEYAEFPNDENSVDAIAKYTDPDAVFAHGSDADKTLDFMRTLPFGTVPVKMQEAVATPEQAWPLPGGFEAVRYSDENTLELRSPEGNQIGFMAWRAASPRAGVTDRTVEIEHLEIDKPYRGRRLGEAMLRQLKALLPTLYPHARYVVAKTATSKGIINLLRRVFGPELRAKNTEKLPKRSPADWLSTLNRGYVLFRLSEAAQSEPNPIDLPDPDNIDPQAYVNQLVNADCSEIFREHGLISDDNGTYGHGRITLNHPVTFRWHGKQYKVTKLGLDIHAHPPFKRWSTVSVYVRPINDSSSKSRLNFRFWTVPLNKLGQIVSQMIGAIKDVCRENALTWPEMIVQFKGAMKQFRQYRPLVAKDKVQEAVAAISDGISKETVDYPAVYVGGKIFIGPSHYHIVSQLEASAVDVSDAHHGWWTSRNRFLDTDIDVNELMRLSRKFAQRTGEEPGLKGEELPKAKQMTGVREVHEGVDDPSPEFMQATFDVPAILKRRGYERHGTQDQWSKVFRWMPTNPDTMIEVRRRGAGGEQNEGDIVYDTTLYRTCDNTWTPVAHRYQRNNKNLEPMLIALEARAKTNQLRGIVADPQPELDEALPLPKADPDLLPDPDDPTDALKSHAQGLAAELMRLGFKPKPERGVEQVYGEQIPRLWWNKYAGADSKPHSLSFNFSGGQTPEVQARNYNIDAKAWFQKGKEPPLSAPARSGAHLAAIIRDLDRAMKQSAADSLPPEQEHEALARVIHHHRTG